MQLLKVMKLVNDRSKIRAWFREISIMKEWCLFIYWNALLGLGKKGSLCPEARDIINIGVPLKLLVMWILNPKSPREENVSGVCLKSLCVCVYLYKYVWSTWTILNLISFQSSLFPHGIGKGYYIMKFKFFDITFYHACLLTQLLSHVWLFATPWTVAHQASLSIGFFLQWGCHFFLQGNLPDSGIKPVSHALAGGFFTTEPPGKPQLFIIKTWNGIWKAVQFRITVPTNISFSSD